MLTNITGKIPTDDGIDKRAQKPDCHAKKFPKAFLAHNIFRKLNRITSGGMDCNDRMIEKERKRKSKVKKKRSESERESEKNE